MFDRGGQALDTGAVTSRDEKNGKGVNRNVAATRAFQNGAESNWSSLMRNRKSTRAPACAVTTAPSTPRAKNEATLGPLDVLVAENAALQRRVAALSDALCAVGEALKQMECGLTEARRVAAEAVEAQDAAHAALAHETRRADQAEARLSRVAEALKETAAPDDATVGPSVENTDAEACADADGRPAFKITLTTEALEACRQFVRAGQAADVAHAAAAMIAHAARSMLSTHGPGSRTEC